MVVLSISIGLKRDFWRKQWFHEPSTYSDSLVLLGYPELRLRTYIIVSIVGWLVVAGLCFGVFRIKQKMQPEIDRFHAACKAELASFPVDFSKAGVYEGPLVHSYDRGHRARLYLDVSPSAGEANMVDGLCLRMDVTDASGEVVKGEDWKVAAEDKGRKFGLWGSEFQLDGLSFEQITTGQLRITVLEPARNLNGVPQRIHVGYVLCGLEEMGDVIVAGYCAMGMVAVAAVIAIILLCSGAWKAIIWLIRARRDGAKGAL